MGRAYIRMGKPDYLAARQYALDRLAAELPQTAHYHSLRHTRDDVLGAAERLAALEGVEGEDQLCLLTAAAFHDLGYIDRPDDHEAESARIAADVLPRFGYSAPQIDLITSLIMATKWPPQPQTLLERIIADADMDALGRDDFLDTSLELRRERAAGGQVLSDAAWYALQLEFLVRHDYFTDAARRLRGDGKRLNIARVRALLDGREEQAET